MKNRFTIIDKTIINLIHQQSMCYARCVLFFFCLIEDDGDGCIVEISKMD